MAETLVIWSISDLKALKLLDYFEKYILTVKFTAAVCLILLGVCSFPPCNAHYMQLFFGNTGLNPLVPFLLVNWHTRQSEWWFYLGHFWAPWPGKSASHIHFDASANLAMVVMPQGASSQNPSTNANFADFCSYQSSNCTFTQNKLKKGHIL